LVGIQIMGPTKYFQLVAKRTVLDALLAALTPQSPAT